MINRKISDIFLVPAMKNCKKTLKLLFAYLLLHKAYDLQAISTLTQKCMVSIACLITGLCPHIPGKFPQNIAGTLQS